MLSLVSRASAAGRDWKLLSRGKASVEGNRGPADECRLIAGQINQRAGGVGDAIHRHET